jgi:2-desacetyl-2-hydroxyethyl bacteriochlorophyllide A dehydrogenase
MRALVCHGPEDIRCESVPDPKPADAAGAVVRAEGTGICGSDLHLYHGKFPIPEHGFVIGHEVVGEVVETGSAVRDFHSGDRVLVSAVIGCGACARCRRGEVVRCERFETRVFGVGGEIPGGQAEALAVPAADHAMRRIPEGISVEQAVLLTDILPTGFHGARIAEVEPGDDVAVIGLGPVGLMAILCAQLFGAARIFAIDTVPERLAAARELGAIPLAAAEAEVRVAEATAGQGADAAIEAVGADETILQAIRLVRQCGRVSVIGVNMNPELAFPMGMAFMKNLTLRAGLVPVPETWPILVPLVASGRLAPERVFTHRLGLSEGAEAYRLFAERRDGVLKVLLDPSR